MALDPNRVAELLQTLSPLQEKVVRLYFGLGCQRCYAASEIARELDVSPQVIRGVLGEAQRKLAQGGLKRDELRHAARTESRVARRTLRCDHPL
jgi:DNA-directed RNA polymerase sigma subunit (sigma70/sigma32)